MTRTNIELNDINNIEIIEDNKQTKTDEEEIDQYTYFMTLFINLIGIFSSLYGFLFALALMGDSFKVLGGRTGNLFKNIDNPIAGLMIGIFRYCIGSIIINKHFCNGWNGRSRYYISSNSNSFNYGCKYWNICNKFYCINWSNAR